MHHPSTYWTPLAEEYVSSKPSEKVTDRTPQKGQRPEGRGQRKMWGGVGCREFPLILGVFYACLGIYNRNEFIWNV